MRKPIITFSEGVSIASGLALAGALGRFCVAADNLPLPSPVAAVRGGREISVPPDLSPKQIYQKDAPATVLLMCFESNGVGELGTGSIIDRSGKILTNAHVVLHDGKPYEKIRLFLKPAHLTGDAQKDLVNPYGAHVIASDADLDLALLQLDHTAGELPVIPLADADQVEPGDAVVAIGHPEQGGLWTLTAGVVSTVVANMGGVSGKDVFQTDASINRGNSGGPLLNREGALIGVNTSMARKAEDGLAITSVNFSLKSNVVKNWLAKAGAVVKYQEFAEGKVSPAASGDAPQSSETQPEKKASPGPRAEILTPVKPYDIDDLMAKQIAEMEDTIQEMRSSLEKQRQTP